MSSNMQKKSKSFYMQNKTANSKILILLILPILTKNIPFEMQNQKKNPSLAKPIRLFWRDLLEEVCNNF